MTEMNSVSRFFVNLSANRRASRALRWVRESGAIPEAASCLEIGCGNASFGARFVETFQPSHYVATDLDPTQLASARVNLAQRYPDAMPPTLMLREADMLHLPFADYDFNVVLTFVTLHHASPNHHEFGPVTQALSEIDRVLRRGGVLIYQEFLHREPIRRWLVDHRYTIEQLSRGWRLEFVIARKTVDPAAKVLPPWGAPPG